MGDVGSDEARAVEAFLRRVQEALERDLVAARATPQKSILFVSGPYCWALDATDSYAVKAWKTGEPALCEVDCTLSMELPTLSAIATGSIRPMQAYLSGKLQFQGDRHVMREYGEAIRASIQATPASLDSGALQVQVVNAVSERVADGDMSKPRRGDDTQDMVIKYVLQVTDTRRGRSWTVRRRFSEFVKLRAALVQQGHVPPQLKGRTRLFYSQDAIVSLRMANLDGFVAQLLQKVPSDNFLVSAFLLNDARALFAQQLRPSLNDSNDVMLTDALGAIQTHLDSLSRPPALDAAITPAHDAQALRRNAFLCQELASLRARVASLEGSSARDEASSGGRIAQVLRWLQWGFVVALATFFACGPAADPAGWAFFRAHLSLTLLVFFVAASRRVSLVLWAFTAAVAVRLALVSPSPVSMGATALEPARQAGRLVADLLFSATALSSLPAQCALATHLAGLVMLLVVRGQPRLVRSLFICALGIALMTLYFVLPRALSALGVDDRVQDRMFAVIDREAAAFVTSHIRELKSVFIKFAQYMAARRDLLSPTWCKAMSALQDACACSPFAYVRRVVRDELNLALQGPAGEPVELEDVFVEFNAESVASASIAQVHFATLDLRKVRRLRPRATPSSVNRGGDMEQLRQEKTAAEQRETDWAATLKALDDIAASPSTLPAFSAQRPTAGAIAGAFAAEDTPSAARDLLSVAVKVQHEDIARTMTADMDTVVFLANIAARLDGRWASLMELLQVWREHMLQELDFEHEGANLEQVARAMAAAPVESAVPVPVRPMVLPRVLVMTRLHGFKVTDRLPLTIYNVDRRALVAQVAHCCAYQLLYTGFFNSDPHAGNLLCCMRGGRVVPGLLDFGMTVTLSAETRRRYCALVLALFEGEYVQAAQVLRELGYATTQSGRAPERDAEFFEHLLRDVAGGAAGRADAEQYTRLRDQQRAQDVADGVREREGRQITQLPRDFLHITRVIGLLRGLAAELDCECPILYILALHAKAGLRA